MPAVIKGFSFFRLRISDSTRFEVGKRERYLAGD